MTLGRHGVQSAAPAVLAERVPELQPLEVARISRLLRPLRAKLRTLLQERELHPSVFLEKPSGGLSAGALLPPPMSTTQPQQPRRQQPGIHHSIPPPAHEVQLSQTAPARAVVTYARRSGSFNGSTGRLSRSNSYSGHVSDSGGGGGGTTGGNNRRNVAFGRNGIIARAAVSRRSSDVDIRGGGDGDGDGNGNGNGDSDSDSDSDSDYRPPDEERRHQQQRRQRRLLQRRASTDSVSSTASSSAVPVLPSTLPQVRSKFSSPVRRKIASLRDTIRDTVRQTWIAPRRPTQVRGSDAIGSRDEDMLAFRTILGLGNSSQAPNKPAAAASSTAASTASTASTTSIALTTSASPPLPKASCSNVLPLKVIAAMAVGRSLVEACKSGGDGLSRYHSLLGACGLGNDGLAGRNRGPSDRRSRGYPPDDDSDDDKLFSSDVDESSAGVSDDPESSRSALNSWMSTSRRLLSTEPDAAYRVIPPLLRRIVLAQYSLSLSLSSLLHLVERPPQQGVRDKDLVHAPAAFHSACSQVIMDIYDSMVRAEARPLAAYVLQTHFRSFGCTSVPQLVFRAECAHSMGMDMPITFFELCLVPMVTRHGLSRSMLALWVQVEMQNIRPLSLYSGDGTDDAAAEYARVLDRSQRRLMLLRVCSWCISDSRLFGPLGPVGPCGSGSMLVASSSGYPAEFAAVDTLLSWVYATVQLVLEDVRDIDIHLRQADSASLEQTACGEPFLRQRAGRYLDICESLYKELNTRCGTCSATEGQSDLTPASSVSPHMMLVLLGLSLSQHVQDACVDSQQWLDEFLSLLQRIDADADSGGFGGDVEDETAVSGPQQASVRRLSPVVREAIDAATACIAALHPEAMLSVVRVLERHSHPHHALAVLNVVIELHLCSLQSDHHPAGSAPPQSIYTPHLGEASLAGVPSQTMCQSDMIDWARQLEAQIAGTSSFVAVHQHRPPRAVASQPSGLAINMGGNSRHNHESAPVEQARAVNELHPQWVYDSTIDSFVLVSPAKPMMVLADSKPRPAAPSKLFLAYSPVQAKHQMPDVGGDNQLDVNGACLHPAKRRRIGINSSNSESDSDDKPEALSKTPILLSDDESGVEDSPMHMPACSRGPSAQLPPPPPRFGLSDASRSSIRRRTRDVVWLTRQNVAKLCFNNTAQEENVFG